MERGRGKSSSMACALLAAVLLQNMVVVPVMSRSLLQGVAEEKNYYSHDPHHTPKSSPKSPSPRSGSGVCSPPSGGYSTPTPSTPVTTPSTPVTTPSTPVTTPSTPVTTPSTPVTTPSTPVTTPSTPVTTPSTPITTPSSPPYVPDPNNFPPFFTGTCDYWRSHPNLIWGLCGFWGTVGSIFGVASTPAFSPSLSLIQAVSNTRTDGFGALYREGTASLLNSMVNKRFPFTTQQVKNGFAAALISNKAAGAQAGLFRRANEGKLKHFN